MVKIIVDGIEKQVSLSELKTEILNLKCIYKEFTVIYPSGYIVQFYPPK